jgi:hypothetical protein
LNIFTSIKRYIISVFREAFIWHINSLEFRAKLLAVSIASKGIYDDCDRAILDEISKSIYQDDDRANMLIQAIEEVITKLLDGANEFNLNRAIILIDLQLKKQPRYAQKIIMSDLRRFQECHKLDEDAEIMQQRVFEYLENRVIKKSEEDD